MNATLVGALAAQALQRSAGWAFPLAEFPDAPYLRAGGEIIWLGGAGRAGDGAMHPRMVLLDAAAPRGGSVRIDARAARVWTPMTPAVPADFVARVRALRRDLRAIDAPRGLAPLLVGETPAFPLDLAVAHVRKVASALPDGAWVDAALPLLGLGTGLTPSGDDFVGGLIFARRLVAPGAELDAACARILAAAAARTHAISAALLADLARGAAYERLHTLAATLSIEAARRLVSIGHSSGWDMLTGFIIGATEDAP